MFDPSGRPRKPVVWLDAVLRSPPLSVEARLAAGERLRMLQGGMALGMPVSRPLPSVGPPCHELRVRDGTVSWRIVYRLDPDAVVVVAVFAKKTAQTPHHVMTVCRQRLRRYDARSNDE